MMEIKTKCPNCFYDPIYPYLGKVLDRDHNEVEDVSRFDLTRFCNNCGKLLQLGFNPANKYFCWIYDSNNQTPKLKIS